MRPKHALPFVLALTLAALLAAASPAAAQTRGTFTASLLYGVGASLDRSNGGSGNESFQLGLAMAIDTDTAVGVRYGRIDFGPEPSVGGINNLEITYVNVAAEYRIEEKYYETGIYGGLGSYRLEGTLPGLGSQAETTLGVVIGVTGEFEVTRKFSVLMELGVHFADFAPADIFGTAHGGVVYHF